MLCECRCISEMHIISFNMPCYLKAAISVSGVGIYRCANREELCDAMKNLKLACLCNCRKK